MVIKFTLRILRSGNFNKITYKKNPRLRGFFLFSFIEKYFLILRNDLHYPVNFNIPGSVGQFLHFIQAIRRKFGILREIRHQGIFESWKQVYEIVVASSFPPEGESIASLPQASCLVLPASISPLMNGCQYFFSKSMNPSGLVA